MTLNEVDLHAKIAALETENTLLLSQLSAVESSMREYRERLDVTAIATGIGFWQWDILTTQLDWDAQCTRFFGLSPSQPDFYTMFERLVLPEDYRRLEQQYYSILESHQDLETEVRILRKDGQLRWIYTRGQCVFDPSDRPLRFIGIAMDVTERRILEQILREDASRIEVQRRLMEQREQERQQIARDLHDGPVQDLTADTFLLHEVMDHCSYPAEKKQLAQVVQSLQEQIQELRAFAVELRPPLLIQFGLDKAIQSHLEAFRAKHPRIAAELTFTRDGPMLPEGVRLAFYRIFQEAMNNVVKHSQASQVTIAIRIVTGRYAHMEIHDNGVGFSPAVDWLELARQGHLGLVGMRERAEAIGGRLAIVSQANCGTTLTLDVGWESPEPAPEDAVQ